MVLHLRRRGRSIRAAIRIGLGSLLALALTLVAVLPASAGDGTWTRVADFGTDGGPLAVSPTNQDVILATHDGLVLSTDRGKSWESVGFPGSGDERFLVDQIAFDPQDASIAYAAISQHWSAPAGAPQQVGLQRSSDGGRHWSRVLAGNQVTVSVNQRNPKVVFATADRGVYKSSDRGLTWQKMRSPFRDAALAVAAHPSNPDLVLLAGVDSVDERVETQPGVYGLARSTDGGKSWSRVLSRMEAYAGVGSPAHYASLLLTFDTSGSAAFACSSAGILRSQDSGKTWKTVYSHRFDPRVGSSYRVLAANPLSPSETFFAAFWSGSAWDKGIWRSSNSGSSFASFVSPPGDPLVYSLAFDRGSPQVLYASTSDGLWAYTLGKTAASGTPSPMTTVTPSTATPTLSPIPTSTATPQPGQTPIPTATSVAMETPVPSSSSTPTPSTPLLAAVAPTASVAVTPSTTSWSSERSGFGSTVAAVGAGALVLAVGALAGRRIRRGSP